MTSTLLTGRGLWYGGRTFTLSEWDQACQQAHRWGIGVVHPKIGDGIAPHIFWYDGPTLEKMRDIATNTYHLRIVPYLYVRGGATLDKEVVATKIAGTTFGSVVLDMEDEWIGHPDWAIDFGRKLRESGYSAPVYATVYANPEQHPTPLVEMNTWIDAFLPQVYFSLWTPKTAAHAISYFLPQWERLAAQLAGEHQVLSPILPIISLGDGLPASEVSAFLTTMQHYGYCGFWYDEAFAPYATTVQHAPLPQFTTPLQQKEHTMASYNQNLSPDELKVLWQMNGPIIWNPQTAIIRLWTSLMQTHPDIYIGSPTHNEQTANVDGQDVTYITFTSGRKIVYFKHSGKTCLY